MTAIAKINICLSICFLLLFSAITANCAVVKKTSSDICHPKDSPYYKRIKIFTSYPTLEACLNTGGRLPKKYKPDSVSHTSCRKEPIHHDRKYKRSYFGHGWADLDHDCQDSRQEALILQSTAPVRFKDSNKHCRVTSGRWISPFSGSVIHDPSAIDIDHVVPLKWAWKHGASDWKEQKRKQFANDPANLLSVEASLNRQKGSRGPEEWLPPSNQCEYILRFLRIAKKYNLRIPASIATIRKQVCRTHTFKKN